MLVWFNQLRANEDTVNEVFPLAELDLLEKMDSFLRFFITFLHILSGPITICDISI